MASQWKEKLSTIDSVIGRLELVSSLRDPHTGRYVHHGMSVAVGDRTHDVLLKSHEATFAEWQSKNLGAQLQDLKAFVRSVPLPGGLGRRLDRSAKSTLVLETWLKLEPYRNFVPLSASKLERDAFLANLTTLIAVLKAQMAQPQQRAMGSTGPED